MVVFVTVVANFVLVLFVVIVTPWHPLRKCLTGLNPWPPP